MSKTKAVVKYFNPQHNHGKAYTDDGKEVYIHVDKISDEAKILIEKEEVEFDIVEGERRGKIEYSANNVKRITPRYTGVIVDFADGIGRVRCKEDREYYDIHYREFIDTRGNTIYENTMVKMIEGDDIEFDKTKHRGNNAAGRIYYDSRLPLYKFAQIPNMDRKFSDLALLSPEPWNYLNSDPENKFLPVLKNYILYTFARLKKEEAKYDIMRISYSTTEYIWKGKKRDIQCACFNTGLANQRQEGIYAFFVENLNRKSVLEPKWVLSKFCKSSDRDMSVFKEKPESPDYFREITDISEIIYNPSLDHELNYEHILKDRNKRFQDLANMSDYMLQSLLEQGLKTARERVRRNYKAAVPQYYNGKIQLLLPLSLKQPDKTELALVVEREGERYFSSTVLELEWAYSNARLIAKPDREWLDPVAEIDENELENIKITEAEM
ncbi:DUF3825 domain-containing protein [Bernardetia sp. OM2101]|uniref:DUF3825 domain-containing protein n=1 Tax=Bernardetia sp. OM2101 TaxID=3344876 RepID=UPI0035CED2BB